MYLVRINVDMRVDVRASAYHTALTGGTRGIPPVRASGPSGLLLTPSWAGYHACQYIHHHHHHYHRVQFHIENVTVYSPSLTGIGGGPPAGKDQPVSRQRSRARHE